MAGPTARVFDSLDGAQDCESLRSQMVLILLVQTPYFDNRHFKAKVFERTVLLVSSFSYISCMEAGME